MSSKAVFSILAAVVAAAACAPERATAPGSAVPPHFDVAATADWGACMVEASGTTYKLLADCVTDQTLLIPDGYTLDGDGHSITAVDPSGGHFLGAVVKNAGSTANVTSVTVTAAGLANQCDGGTDRLRGVLLDGASGAITDVTVLGINQGLSGCQEGNGIEVRNAPFDGTHPNTQTVVIQHNVVRGYQKTGIVANGDVTATIAQNEVGSAGLDDYIAANSVQIGFGASASVNNNVIEGNDWDGASYFDATAVLIFLAGDVTVNHNLIGTLGEDEMTDIGVLAELSGTVNVINNTIQRAGEDESGKPCATSAERPLDSRCDPDGVGVFFFENGGKSKVVKNAFSNWRDQFQGEDLAKRNVEIVP